MTIWIESKGKHIELNMDNISKLFDGSIETVITVASQTDEAKKWNNKSRCILLQANNNEEYKLKEYYINAGAFQCESFTNEQKIKRWHGANLSTLDQLSHERLYLVTCIDLTLLSFRRVNDQLQPIGASGQCIRNRKGVIMSSINNELSELTLRRMEVSASRALYALMMDIGSVLVAVSGTGSIAIREVWPITKAGLPHDHQMICEALLLWTEELDEEHSKSLTIGADPEFIIVDKEKRLVKASQFFLDFDDDQVGVDSIQWKGKILHPIVELRPEPSTHPERLFNKIHSLLKDAHAHVSDLPFQWLAGAMPLEGIALGGHIHFSGVRITPRLLRLFDLFLAIPFAAIADPSGDGRYRKFGGFGDYRKQFHGGFEYRTLPSWLISPALTRSALYLSWVIVVEQEKITDAVKGNAVEKWWISFPVEDRIQLAEAATELLTRLENIAFEDEQQQLLNRALYPILKALDTDKKWNEATDIQVRWSLVTNETP